MTIFQKVINKEIPADIVFEDDLCLAFRDINPQAPIHILIIPRSPVASTQEVDLDDARTIGHIFSIIPKIASTEGIDKTGYRVVTNCRSDGGQEVAHLHFHLLGGRKLNWPPG